MPSPSSRKQSKNFPLTDAHGSVKKRIKWIICTHETLLCSESITLSRKGAHFSYEHGRCTASYHGGWHWMEGILTKVLLIRGPRNVASHSSGKYLWRYLREKVFFTLGMITGALFRKLFSIWERILVNFLVRLIGFALLNDHQSWQMTA